MEAILALKRLQSVLDEPKPDQAATEKVKTEWESRNQQTVAYIRLHLSDEQALQFATETEARQLWRKIKSAYAGAAEDQKIDAGNDRKYLRMAEKETVSDYIARARGIATKCASLELQVTPRELAYYTVRGINNQYKDIREILKTQRDKSIEEIQEILKEKEKEVNRRDSHFKDAEGAAYAVRKENSNPRRCYECGRIRHIAKACWYRRSERDGKQPEQSHNRGRPRYVPNAKGKEHATRKTANNIARRGNDDEKVYAFNVNGTASEGNIQNINNSWLFDSGVSNHMVNELK
ncbi:hypothetical protein KPH14_012815 [Odynerus spinipes]|uniref:CCHC-type domain-containing protein n=1 Tax=Odynerus spinipes TaxID=1348599 RepID=A0AAD9REC2_9HYME|nr:hypothetical protein KPH14_012815 [Odynerus spinipes]